MTILDNISNREQAAQQSIENPALLDEIVLAFPDENGNLVTHCIAVFRIVSETHPELIAPHAWQVAELLTHKRATVRREAIHTIKLMAHLRPDVIHEYLYTIMEMIRLEVSTVSGYGIDAIGIYGGANELTARSAYFHLARYLNLHEGRYTARILRNLELAAKTDRESAKIIRRLARRYHEEWAQDKETRQAAGELWEAVRWRGTPKKSNE